MSAQPDRFDIEIAPVERPRLLGRSLVAVAFRCAPTHPHFRGCGPLPAPCLGLPRRCTQLSVEGGGRFLSDPTGVVLFNQGTVYQRDVLDPEGEDAEVIALAPDELSRWLAEWAPQRLEHGIEQAFDHNWQALPGVQLASLRRRLAALAEDPDPTRAEEAAAALVGELLRLTLADAKAARRRRAAYAETLARERVHAIKQHVAARIEQAHPVADLASRVGWSTFHLAHEFARIEGRSLHAWLLQLRLQLAAERLGDYRGRLAELALSLGFNSHSHLSAQFQRRFGCSPSQWLQHAPSQPQRGEAIRRSL